MFDVLHFVDYAYAVNRALAKKINFYVLVIFQFITREKLSVTYRGRTESWGQN